MSHENVETARRMADAFNRTVTQADDDFFGFLHDEVEWAGITALLDGRTYHGPDEVRNWVTDLKRDWETYEIVWDDVRDLDGDRVLAIGSWHARGRRSGVDLHLQQAAWIVHVRGRKLIRLQTFTDRSAALEALGLRE
jgi:ketosteroid isomerase-like protein